MCILHQVSLLLAEMLLTDECMNIKNQLKLNTVMHHSNSTIELNW